MDAIVPPPLNLFHLGFRDQSTTEGRPINPANPDLEREGSLDDISIFLFFSCLNPIYSLNQSVHPQIQQIQIQTVMGAAQLNIFVTMNEITTSHHRYRLWFSS